MPNTIQSGILTNHKNYDKFSYWLAGVDVTHQNLDGFTPYIQGVSRIYVYRTPYFMDNEKTFKDLTATWKSLIERGYTRIDGIGDISVDFVDFEGGFAGQKFSAVSLARDDTDSLTISVYEQTGSPCREFMDTWVTGVRDPRSGIAHYHGAIAAGVCKYGEINHSAEFVYVTMDPTGQDIEYCAMFAHAFPTKVSKNHLNYEKGNRQETLMDLEFRATKYESAAINQIGAYYVTNSKINYNYLDFSPYLNDKGVSDDSVYKSQIGDTSTI